jgi:mannose-6-phosphate isomerase-like protein (cupin superfamily)
MELPQPYNLGRLHIDVTEAWKSFDVATVNGNAVRFRVVENQTANWRVHEQSDELFYVVSGSVL